jgi:hypothetical protein
MKPKFTEHLSPPASSPDEWNRVIKNIDQIEVSKSGYGPTQSIGDPLTVVTSQDDLSTVEGKQ